MLFPVGPCAKCKTEMSLPGDLYNAARSSAKITFYCAYGHPQHFAEGPSEAELLRRERDRLQQRLAQKDDEIASQREQREAAERRAAAARGQVTKIRNRVGRGVCPCCNRAFENLSRHMASKHPQFHAEAAE